MTAMLKQFSFLILLQIILINITLFAQASKSKIDSINTIGYDEVVSNIEQSTKLFTENLEKARSITYPKGEGQALSNLALVNYLKGNYDKSTQYHIESFKIFNDNKMYKELSDAYGEYGYQLKRRDLNKALSYMRLAIKVADDYNVSRAFKSKLYDNYGVLKEMQNDADSAIFFYKKALEIKKANRDTIGIPYSLNKIAVLKANQGKFSEAYKYLNLSDNLRNTEIGNFGRMENLSFHADFLRMENRLDEAIEAYEKCMEMAKDLNYTYMILYCYENLTQLYKQQKQFDKALETHLKYTVYKDSIDNYETNTKVAQLEIAYETEQKNKLIAENKFELENRKQQLTFALVSLVLLVLIIIAVYKYQQQKRKRVVKEIEYKNQLQSTELEKKIVEEKLNISRELHDNIGSQLTFIISSLDNLTYSEKSNAIVPRLNTIKNFSKDALLDLRNTIWAMKHEDGDLETLVIKLNEMIQKLNSSLNGIVITVEKSIQGNIKLSSTQMLNLFRIVQESVQNSIKHSIANTINIMISKTVNGFEIIIKDNGKGFFVDESSDGNGLENIKIRCAQAGGKCIIVSNETGTLISCEITIN
ncbi:MAG: tetratricopeptide repeat protein [Ignavibacteriales bacterium]|nr:tetratricopeptide repeat protein [Ignavibacteriales bacterium]